MVAAVRVHKTGGHEVLTFEEIDVPAPGQGQLRVKQHACGVNFIDTYFRMGMYPSPVGLPFVAGNEGAGEVIAVGPGVTDFKVGDRVGYVTALGCYAAERLVPADRDADAALDQAWARMTGNAKCGPRDISIKGRILHVPCSADGVARFSFADLCEKPLAASDYLRLAHDYHTILVDRIPVMDYPDRNAAKRFIALIDTLYDNAVKLMASAEADPPSLYVATEGHEANEFKRTASRLIEMSSESYLALPHGHKDSAASGSSTGLVET